MIMVLIGNENLIVIFNNYVQTQTNKLTQTNELTLLNNLKIRSLNGRPHLHKVHLAHSFSQFYCKQLHLRQNKMSLHQNPT